MSTQTPTRRAIAALLQPWAASKMIVARKTCRCCSVTVSAFDQALARLVAHEIDHLEGRLYVDRMSAEAPLVPVTEYQQTGLPWTY